MGILVGAISYPNFSFTEVYTSYLGSPTHNPEGYRFYNATVFITGILLIPLFTYFYQQLKPNLALLNGICTFFGILGCIGFALIGIYYQGFDPTGHRITTILAFGGYGGNALFMLLNLIIRFIRKQKMIRFWPVFISYFQLIGIVVFSSTIGIWATDSAYASDQFTEWIFILAVLGWLIDLALMAPRPKGSE